MNVFNSILRSQQPAQGQEDGNDTPWMISTGAKAIGSIAGVGKCASSSCANTSVPITSLFSFTIYYFVIVSTVVHSSSLVNEKCQLCLDFFIQASIVLHYILMAFITIYIYRFVTVIYI